MTLNVTAEARKPSSCPSVLHLATPAAQVQNTAETYVPVNM